MSTSKTMWVQVHVRDTGAHLVYTRVYLMHKAAGWRVVGLAINDETGQLEAEMEYQGGPAVTTKEQ